MFFLECLCIVHKLTSQLKFLFKDPNMLHYIKVFVINVSFGIVVFTCVLQTATHKSNSDVVNTFNTNVSNSDLFLTFSNICEMFSAQGNTFNVDK